jgi:AAA domain
MVKKHAREICKKPVGQPQTAYVGSQANDAARSQVNSAATEQVTAEEAAENWRDYFRSIEQLEDGDVRMIIDGFLPEGINIVAGPAGQGKTLFALSITKALTTGSRFLGKYVVQDMIPVVYMIPESSSRAFKMRCKAFGIPSDPELFLCRTVSEGRTLMLDDPILREAVKALKPVIILDTLPRFNESGDENDAAANKALMDDITTLRAFGAVSVIALHHSTKAATLTTPTLENAIRGTGDLGAMCDSVYSLRRDVQLYDDGKGANEIEVRCVKPRDFQPPMPFKVAASYKNGEDKVISFIDETGDFFVIEAADVIEQQNAKFLKLILETPNIGKKELLQDMGMTEWQLRTLSGKLGYQRGKGSHGRWSKKSANPPTNQPVTPSADSPDDDFSDYPGDSQQ